MGIMSASAYLTVRAPESAWTAGGRANSPAKAASKTHGNAKRGFLFLAGRKEEIDKTNDAGRDNRDRQEQKCFPGEHLLEGVGKHSIPYPQYFTCQDHSGDDTWQAQVENAEPVSHGLAPARTSRPFSKPYFSKASTRFRLSKGSFVYSQ